MASRKDFVQRSRKQSAASPNRLTATKPSAKATPAPKRKPWALALFSLVALTGLVFILNQLLSVDTTQTDNAVSPVKPNHSSTQKSTTIAKQATPTKPLADIKKPVAPAKPETIKTPEQTTPGPTVLEKSVTAEAAKKQNKYEFYELLPKSEITPAAVEEYKSTPRTAKLEKQYVLQAGSFRNAADAEKMRAQLLLSGLSNVHINPSEGANGLWYRVRTGPFDNRSAMNKAHDKLARLNINAMAIRID